MANSFDGYKQLYEKVGTEDSPSVDNVLKKKSEFAILICGSGIGMSITANRFKGIRAALCRTIEDAKLARQHNNANILCLGARNTDPNIITEIVDAFLNTDFEGGRHETRVKKFS